MAIAKKCRGCEYLDWEDDDEGGGRYDCTYEREDEEGNKERGCPYEEED